MTQSGQVPEFVHRSELKEKSSLTAAFLAKEALDLEEEQACWGPSNPARRGLITSALDHSPQHGYSQPSLLCSVKGKEQLTYQH